MTLPEDFAITRLPMVTRDGVLRREHCVAIYAALRGGDAPWRGLAEEVGHDRVPKRGADYRVKRALELLKTRGLIVFRRWEGRGHWAVRL